MKVDFGLEDSDVILIPSLFERCGGNASRWTPPPRVIVGRSLRHSRYQPPRRAEQPRAAAIPGIAAQAAAAAAGPTAASDIIFTEGGSITRPREATTPPEEGEHTPRRLRPTRV